MVASFFFLCKHKRTEKTRLSLSHLLKFHHILGLCNLGGWLKFRLQEDRKTGRCDKHDRHGWKIRVGGREESSAQLPASWLVYHMHTRVNRPFPSSKENLFNFQNANHSTKNSRFSGSKVGKILKIWVYLARLPCFWTFWKMLIHSFLEVAENSNWTFWLNGKRPL